MGYPFKNLMCHIQFEISFKYFDQHVLGLERCIKIFFHIKYVTFMLGSVKDHSAGDHLKD